MKWFGWPRPPLVLGFILGPVIESNLWPAMQIWGVLGILSRPVTLALAIFGVASALYLTWMMGSVSEVEKKCLKLMLRAPTARQKTHREARADDPSSLSGTTKFSSPGPAISIDLGHAGNPELCCRAEPLSARLAFDLYDSRFRFCRSRVYRWAWAWRAKSWIWECVRVKTRTLPTGSASS
jgi:hypothetical protein